MQCSATAFVLKNSDLSFGTGAALRQFVYVDDVAGLVAALVASGPLNKTVNIAPEGHASIRELALAAATAAGYKGEVAFTGKGPDGQLRKDVTAGRLRALVPAWAKIETPLNEGLSKTIRWYRSHVEAR